MCSAISQYQFRRNQTLRLKIGRIRKIRSAVFFVRCDGAMWFLRLALLPMAWAFPCADIHTWHNVTAFRGTWKAQLSSINEKALFYHPNCTEMGAAPTFQAHGHHGYHGPLM